MVFHLHSFFANPWYDYHGRLAQLGEQRPYKPQRRSNISDLAVITMYSNVQHSNKCTVNVQHN